MRAPVPGALGGAPIRRASSPTASERNPGPISRSRAGGAGRAGHRVDLAASSTARRECGAISSGRAGDRDERSGTPAARAHSVRRIRAEGRILERRRRRASSARAGAADDRAPGGGLAPTPRGLHPRRRARENGTNDRRRRPATAANPAASSRASAARDPPGPECRRDGSTETACSIDCRSRRTRRPA